MHGTSIPTHALSSEGLLRRHAHDLAARLPDRDALLDRLPGRTGPRWQDGVPWETVAAFGLGLALGAGVAAVALRARSSQHPPSGPFDPSM
jgi:hypothetical protein